MNVLQAASFDTLQAAARDRANYPAKTVMEVRSLAAFEDGGLPAGFENYMELFHFNNPALGECQAAGMPLKVIGRTAEPRENAGILLRLPLYLQQNIVANTHE
jgi:hypothetical protein